MKRHIDYAAAAAAKNPFRYRGYYYDLDLCFYYLESRYYDPVTCRFISPDDLSYLGANGDLNSYNLYAYCSNDPINYVDPNGHETTTFSVGLYYAGGKMHAVNLGISVDSEDMFAFHLTHSLLDESYGGNVAAGLGAGFSLSIQKTNLSSVSELDTPSKVEGINTPVGGYDSIRNDIGELIGWSISTGLSIGGDTHTYATETVTIGRPYRSVIKIIKDWLGYE